jgi:hypothetical protein
MTTRVADPPAVSIAATSAWQIAIFRFRNQTACLKVSDMENCNSVLIGGELLSQKLGIILVYEKFNCSYRTLPGRNQQELSRWLALCVLK